VSDDRAEKNHEPEANLASTARPAALVVSAVDGIESSAAALASRLNLSVVIAATKSTALRMLDRRRFAIVILDQVFADADPDGSELVWRNSGLAIPLQINFALAGSSRVEREVRAALARREREQQLAAAAASAALDSELKNMITGLLLESQLALAEQNLPPQVASRLRTVVGMAGQLRERFIPTTVQGGTTTGALFAPPK
jgi:hypothetical protein